MADTYRTVISYDETNEAGELITHRFEADIIKPVQENLSTEITNHPLIQGDMIADHMIINPMSLNLSGKFSLNGSKPTEYEGGKGRLANIQDTFERIMKKGILCSVATLLKRGSEYDLGSVRFSSRQNMALNSISWTKDNNSLEFSFGFQQVLTANVDEALYDVDIRDPNLPLLTDPNTLDFTDTYLNWDKIDEMVIKQMKDCELLDDDFLEVVVTINTVLSKASIVAAIASLVVAGLVVNAVIAGTLSVSAAVFPVGTVVAVIGFIFWGLAALFSWFAREANRKVYKIKAFKKYQTDRENQAEVERFINFVGSIHSEMEQLENVMKVYGIVANEAQECMLYIDNHYYIFCFEKLNTAKEGERQWSLKVKNERDELVGQMAAIEGLSKLTDCTSSNMLFRTEGVGSFIYIMNSKQEDLANNGASQEEINEANNDLRNYQVLVTQVKMENFNNLLQDIIKNALEA